VAGGVAGDRFTDTSQYPAWEYDVFRSLGNFHPTTAQLRAMNAVALGEGIPDNQNNWLAITESTPNEWGTTGVAKGARVITGPAAQDGVVQYKTHAQGVQAISDFLQAGHPDLLKLLRDPNATYDQISAAFLANGWPGDKAALQEAGQSNGAFYVPYTSNEKTYSQSSPPTEGGNGCTKGPDLIGFDTLVGHQTILSRCTGKALVGGLLVTFGVAVMVGGLVMVIAGSNDRLGLKEAVQAASRTVSKPINSATNGLNRLASRGGNRRIQADQEAANRYTPPTPPEPKPKPTTSSTRYVRTVPYGPTVSTSKPTPTAEKPTRIPRKQKNAKGPSRT
jgi:hypothetical protein